MAKVLQVKEIVATTCGLCADCSAVEFSTPADSSEPLTVVKMMQLSDNRRGEFVHPTNCSDD